MVPTPQTLGLFSSTRLHGGDSTLTIFSVGSLAFVWLRDSEPSHPARLGKFLGFVDGDFVWCCLNCEVQGGMVLGFALLPV